MTDAEQRQQKWAANTMAAFAHLFGGRPGRSKQFIDRVEILLSGSEPSSILLLQLTERVRATRRPVVWIHYPADVPNVPTIGLVAPDGKKVHVIENCMLWLAKGGSRARLVPDGFSMGAFRFDDKLRLRHEPKAPARDFGAATEDMVRAYDRLLELQVEQHQRGEVFELPRLERILKAA